MQNNPSAWDKVNLIWCHLHLSDVPCSRINTLILLARSKSNSTLHSTLNCEKRSGFLASLQNNNLLNTCSLSASHLICSLCPRQIKSYWCPLMIKKTALILQVHIQKVNQETIFLFEMISFAYNSGQPFSFRIILVSPLFAVIPNKKGNGAIILTVLVNCPH